MRGGGGSDGVASGLKKGPWTAAEDAILMDYVRKHGEGNWNAVQRNSGLSRCGKSCRLRWANHLRPNLKKGTFTPEEELLILRLHAQLGNKWARMAAQLPGRTDNEIKNYWNTRIKRRQRSGLPLYPAEIHRQAQAVAGSPGTPSLHIPNSSSSSDLKSNLFSPPQPPPMALLDSMGYPPSHAAPATSFLTNHHQFSMVAPVPELSRYSRFVDERMPAFHQPFSPPTMSSLLYMQQQPPPGIQFEYNTGNYDFGSSAPSEPQLASLSMKMELPSTQFFPEPTGGDGGDAALLDEMLMHHSSQGTNEPQLFLPQFPDDQHDFKWPLAVSGGDGNDQEAVTDNAAREKIKRGAGDDFSSTQQDITSVMEMIPTTSLPMISAAGGAVAEWYNCDSGELSNGQSVITEDDIGLEMKHLASTLNVAPEDQGWSIGSCSWNNMPGIC